MCFQCELKRHFLHLYGLTEGALIRSGGLLVVRYTVLRIGLTLVTNKSVMLSSVCLQNGFFRPLFCHTDMCTNLLVTDLNIEMHRCSMLLKLCWDFSIVGHNWTDEASLITTQHRDEAGHPTRLSRDWLRFRLY